MASTEAAALESPALTLLQALAALRDGSTKSDKYFDQLWDRYCDCKYFRTVQLSDFPQAHPTLMAARLSDDKSSKSADALAETGAATQAIQAAQQPATDPSFAYLSSALAGMPFVVANNIDAALHQTTHGCSTLVGLSRPTKNAAVVEGMRAAGAWVFAAGTTHSLSLGSTGTATLKGPVVNPWSDQGVAGGASAGAVSAVACRFVPFALGVDGHGDVRVPASLCGVFAFRPSLGRYSMRGVMSLTGTLDTVAPVARSVKDLRLLDTLLLSTREIDTPEYVLPELKKKRPLGEEGEGEEEEGEGGGGGGADSEEEELAAAAARIQALMRGRAARSQVAGLKAEAASAAVDPETAAAAVRIQAIARGRIGRQNVAKQQAARSDAAAAKITALLKGHVARKGLRGATGAPSESKSEGKEEGGEGGLPLQGVRIGLPWQGLWDACDVTVRAVGSEAVKALEAAGATMVRAEFEQVMDAAAPSAAGGPPPGAPQKPSAPHGAPASGAAGAPTKRKPRSLGRQVGIQRAALHAADLISQYEAPRELAAYLAKSGLDAKGVTLAALAEGAVVPDAEKQRLVAQLCADTAVDASTYRLALLGTRAAVGAAVQAYFSTHGVQAVLLPGSTVPSHVARGGDGQALLRNGELVDAREALSGPACIAAVAGCPSVVMPAGTVKLRKQVLKGNPGSERVPVGVELLGAPGGDERLLKLAEGVAGAFSPLVDPVTLRRWTIGVHRPGKAVPP